jgi:dienelactone hydrolase
LVLFSPGYKFDANQYIYAGTRLASHGMVVAILSHAGEGSYSSVADPANALSVVLGNRPRDMSFALTSLLGDSRTKDVIDPSQVVAAGHSYGGYTALALAGGDDSVCDSVEPFYGRQPDGTCVAVTSDRRFKAVISLDGSNDLLTANELARVRVPSMGIGEDEAAIEASAQGWTGYNARPHVFIGARTSYRIDVNHTTHVSYTETCPGWLDILTRAGVFPNERMALEDVETIKWFYCSCPTPDLDGDCVLDARSGHTLITKYMIAFINAYVANGPGRNLLVPRCGQKQEANIDLFTTEVGGDHHEGPSIWWLPPEWTDQFDYYVHQADVPCEDEQ